MMAEQWTWILSIIVVAVSVLKAVYFPGSSSTIHCNLYFLYSQEATFQVFFFTAQLLTFSICSRL